MTLTPNDSKTSALPDFDETERPPCFATKAPDDAATIAARVDTLREIGWVYSEMEKKGILLPVIDLNLKYKKPARYDQILSIESHVLTPPTSKLIFVFKIKHENELLVEAQVTLAFVNASTGLPQRAPDGLCADLEKNGLIHSC